MPQSNYDVNINIKTKDQTSAPAKQASKSLDGLKQAAKALGMVMAAGVAIKYAAELVKVGAAAERQAASLNSLAAAQGESGTAIIKSIQSASDYTIDRMAAMQAANRAMVMDVAQSPEQFERLTRVAVALGRAMGQDATKSIDDFVTASARQSQMIADNLGLTVTVGQATERYAKSLGVTADQLTDAQKKQAFLNMMLEEGEKKMAQLGDQTLDSAGKIEQIETAWTDAKAAVSEAALTVADTTGILDNVSSGFRRWTGDVEIFAQAMRELRAGASIKDALFDIDTTFTGIDSATQSYTAMARAQEEAKGRTTEWSRASDELKASLQDQVMSQGMMEHTILATADAIRREGIVSQNELEATVLGTAAALEAESKAMDGFVRGMDAATKLNLSMSFTGQLESMQESAAQFAADREALEEAHQAKITELKATGTTAMIAEEQRRHDESIALLDAQMAKQQEVQDKAMGQMMLQAFDQWSEQKDIPVEKMLEMRTAIAEEYGLVSEGATALVTDMVSEWDMWAEGTKVSTDQVIDYMSGVIDETGEVRRNLLDLTASEYVIKVRYDVSIPDVVPAPWQDNSGARPGMASGGSFMVGESGAEMITVQPVSRSNTYNDTFNIYDGNAMVAVEENRRRQRRGGIARTM